MLVLSQTSEMLKMNILLMAGVGEDKAELNRFALLFLLLES